MAQIDFKSVGTKAVSTTAIHAVSGSSPQPIGIRTPMQVGVRGEGIFAMNYDLAAQVQDNLRNLLLTNHGDRIGLYDFGANLLPLTMEISNGEIDFDAEAVVRIKSAVSKYMPFIDLQTFESSIDNVDNENVGKFRIRIMYSIPALRVANRAIEITLHVGG